MQTWRKRDIEPKYETCRAAGPELELRYQQLEKRVKVLEESLDNAQRINKELEVDLQTAINEGIKYRDHLACMLDIREKDAKAQGNIKTAQEKENAAQGATLLASLKKAEEEVEFERSRVLNLQNEVNALESAVATKHDEGNERSVQVLLSVCHLSSICCLCNGTSCLTRMGI